MLFRVLIVCKLLFTQVTFAERSHVSFYVFVKIGVNDPAVYWMLGQPHALSF
jgi:hypothetical protein